MLTAGFAIEFFDIDTILNSVNRWRGGNPPKPHAFVHGQCYLHQLARVQGKLGGPIAHGATQTFFRQRSTDTMTP